MLIHNAIIVNESSEHLGWVLTEGDTIADTGFGDAPAELLETTVDKIDADKMLLMPGVIDDHVHFREPGLTHKADIASESAAAVAGGVTSFMDMPNTVPPTVTVNAWEQKMTRAAEVSRANYAFYIGATDSNIDELLAADYSQVPGVKLFLGSSTGNMLVDTDDALNRIFSRVPAIIAVHAEDDARVRAHIDIARDTFGDDPVPIDLHSVIRDSVGCYCAAMRAINLAQAHEARLHLLHITTGAEVRAIEAVRRTTGRITAETCPQYLLWSDKDYDTLGARMKCNPAVKTQTDRNILRRAVKDGTISVIGSDHAPHLLSEKAGDALTAPSGCPGIQTMLPMMLSLFTPSIAAEKMAHAPARLFGINRRGFIRRGYYADLVLVRHNDTHTIADSDSLSLCGWLPTAGTECRFRVDTTIVNGQIAYRHGQPLPDRIAGMPLAFNNNA